MQAGVVFRYQNSKDRERVDVKSFLKSKHQRRINNHERNKLVERKRPQIQKKRDVINEALGFTRENIDRVEFRGQKLPIRQEETDILFFAYCISKFRLLQANISIGVSWTQINEQVMIPFFSSLNADR